MIKVQRKLFFVNNSRSHSRVAGALRKTEAANKVKLERENIKETSNKWNRTFHCNYRVMGLIIDYCVLAEMPMTGKNEL